jgi:hypothetical protein
MFKRVGMLLVLVAVIIGSTVPAYAGYGYRGYGHGGYGYRGHGYRGHGYYGYRGYGYRGHGYYGSSVRIIPQIIVPFGVPYLYPPAVVSPPPVYVQPAPQVYVQPPPPQPYWYYCDNPQGYYPYVAQCPGGWQQVAPTPPR